MEYGADDKHVYLMIERTLGGAGITPNGRLWATEHYLTHFVPIFKN